MKLLTIVIPTYNMEKYLANCIESFVSEHELFSEIEVLIVNDGSKDNSIHIAKEYEEKYPESIKVIDKENGGHGSTINVGIKEAQGKYFRVVDSDDWVDTKNFYSYLEKLKNIDADMVFTSYSSVDEQTKQKKRFMYNSAGIQKGEVCNIDEFIKTRNIIMHTITYRTAILRESHTTLDEHCFYVDTEYVMFPLKYVQTCVLLSENVYMYRTNMSTQSCSDDGYFRHCEDHQKVTLHLLQYMKQELDKETSVAKKKYIYKIVLSLVKKQYRIFLMKDWMSSENRTEVIQYDKAVRKLSRKFYKALEQEEYIEELHAKKFRFYGYCKIKFHVLRKMGKYPSLDF